MPTQIGMKNIQFAACWPDLYFGAEGKASPSVALLTKFFRGASLGLSPFDPIQIL